MKKILLLVIVFISIFAVGCGSKKEESDLDKLLNEKEYIIVDVRTKEEYDLGAFESIDLPKE